VQTLWQYGLPETHPWVYHWHTTNPGVQDWHATHPGVLGWLCPAPGRPWRGSSCFLWLQSLLCRSRACSFRTLERNKNFWLWADFSLASTSSKNQHLNTVIEFMNGSCLPKRCFVQQFSESVLWLKLVKVLSHAQGHFSMTAPQIEETEISITFIRSMFKTMFCWFYVELWTRTWVTTGCNNNKM